MQLLTLTLLAISFAACNSNHKKGSRNHEDENMAGGPCTYREEINPIRVLEVKKMENGEYNLQLVSASGRRQPSPGDTFYYSSRMHQQTISDSIIRVKNIRAGDTIQLLEAHILSGSCNPHVVSVGLEKYKSPANPE